MTATDRPDDRADVIEQAAKVMADNRGRNWRMMLSEYRSEHLRDARALSDAGLLVSPADQDDTAKVARVRALANDWDKRGRCGEAALLRAVLDAGGGQHGE